MSDREPEPWERTAPGPFLAVDGERGTVSVRALAEDRYVIETAEREETVVGFDAARDAAHALTSQLE